MLNQRTVSTVARLVFCVCFAFSLMTSSAWAARVIKGEEVWKGKVTISENVIVPADASLRIEPGTDIRFAANTSLAVEGDLVARGSDAKPIRFRSLSPDPAQQWQGILFQNAKKPVTLESVKIEGAQLGLTVVGSRVRMLSSEITNGKKAIQLAIESYTELKGVTIRNMTEGGIEASVRARGLVDHCRLEDIPAFGVQAEKQSSVMVRDSRLTNVRFGVLVSGDFAPLQGNHIEGGEIAIGVTQGSPNGAISDNTISGVKTGVACRQFTSPLIENNIIRDCEVAIDCFQGSNPSIRHNRLTHCKRAIQCVQMSNPLITYNGLSDNTTGIYLHLSAYAQIHDNNFDRNQLHVELDNMSYDWEVRASHKPKRNRQAQNEVLVKQGKAQPEDVKVTVDSEGFVDARRNYWGGTTTAEMANAGNTANIASLHDGYDEPTRSYEGWPGEYKIDKIRYDDWLSKPVADAGPRKNAKAGQ